MNFLKYFLFVIFLISKTSSSLSLSKFNAFVHIGPHKSGSTQLQFALHLKENVDLFQTFGFKVIGLTNKHSSCLFSHGLDGEKVVYHFGGGGSLSECQNQTFFHFASKQIAACDSDIIISADSLDRTSLSGRLKLKKMLSCYDVKILAFHRSRLNLIRSHWAQTNARILLVTSFLEFMYSRILDIGSDHMINYNLNTVLREYADLFGKTNVEVIHFEGAVEQFGSPFRAFLKWLGLKNESLLFREEKRVLNTSPSVLELDLRRHISIYARMNGLKLSSSHDLQRIHDCSTNRLQNIPSQTVKLEQMSLLVEKADQQIIKDYVTHFQPKSNKKFKSLEIQLINLRKFNINNLKEWNEILNCIF